MTDKKILLIAVSMVPKVEKYLTEHDLWDSHEAVIVRDEDYEAACKSALDQLPEGKRMRTVQFEDLIKE